MSDGIRELVRYQIPGYICLVLTAFLLIPFVDFEQLLAENAFPLVEFLLTALLSGIAAGWLLFQFYNGFRHESLGNRYAWKEPRTILRKWNSGAEVCPQFRDRLMDYALQKSDLRQIAGTYWSHAQSLYVTGRLVPFFAILLAVAVYLLSLMTPLRSVFVTDYSQVRVLQSFAIWCVSSFVLLIISLRIPRILDEVQNFIVISLLANDEEIKRIMRKRSSAIKQRTLI